MSREYPDFVNPRKAAEGQRTFSGTMPLSRMHRLGELLAAQSERKGLPGWEEATFTGRFAFDEQGLLTVDLEVRASLPLVCQRSLAAYLEPVDRRSVLAVVESEWQADELPGSYEPVLVPEGRVALLDLVEDELILAVPQVPRSPSAAEVKYSTAGDEKAAVAGEAQTRRPFAGLAGLMKEEAED